MKRYVQTTAVLPTRQLIAGNGLTGGGDLSADRTFNAVANADGSIIVNPNDIQVGVISDLQHGTRGGGALHTVASAIASGFMSAADVIKLSAINVTNFDIIPDVASLKAINTTTYTNGQVIYLTEYRDFYTLDTVTVGYVPNDLVVIKPTTGPGNWIAYTEGRWDDLPGDISQGLGGAALTYEEFWDTKFKQYFFRNNQDDSLSMRFQMSHMWRRSSVVYPHLHVVLCADPLVDQDMYFNGQYYWTPVGGKTPSVVSWGTFSFTYTVSPGDIYDNIYIPLFNTAPMVPDTWESSILKIFVQREATNVLDTYDTAKPWGTAAANVGLDSFDVHHIKDKLGTPGQIPTPSGA